MKKKIILISILVIILVILYIFLYTQNNKTTLKSSSDALAIMVQDDNGGDSYHVWDKEYWPGEGYIYNHNKTNCDDEFLHWNEETENISLDNNKSDKCTIYFDKTDKVTEALDLSGNGFDGTFVGNVSVQQDEEGYMGLSFDGEDSYVDIVDLPETINWDDGFTIDFEAKWLSFKNWSRIMDFGNGQNNDNIFVANQGTSSNLNFDSRYGTEATRGNTTVSAAIALNEKTHYRIEVIKNATSYTHNIYKDDALILTKTYNVTTYVRNTNRTENFLGKSNWNADSYFHGFIYNLKITDASGKPILWYKFDK